MQADGCTYVAQRCRACRSPQHRTAPPCPAAAYSDDVLRRALFLTNGNAAELRRFMPGLLGLGADVDVLGLSRGHKAEAARRKKHDQGMVA